MPKQTDLFAGKLDEHLLSPAGKRAIIKQIKENEKARLKALKQKIKLERKEAEAKVIKEQAVDADRLHKLWQELFDKAGCSFTIMRRRHTSKMLVRYGFDTCSLVLEVAARDPNTRGHNRLNRPFDDLVNIFRNEERVDMYIAMGKLTNRLAGHLGPSDAPADAERL